MTKGHSTDKGNGSIVTPIEKPQDPNSSVERRVAKLAVEAGLITDSQLASAIRKQEKTGKPLIDLLRENCGLSLETIQYLQAKQRGVKTVHLASVRLDPEALKKIPGALAMEHRVIPVSISQDRLVVAMVNPFDLATLEKLQFTTRLYIDACYAVESDILEALKKYYGIGGEGSVQPEKSEEENYITVQEGEGIAGPQVMRLVDELVSRAVREEATDIHIEPGEKIVKTRYRIDGILHARPKISKSMQPMVITRIKILANIDISENRLPQDGRISFVKEGKSYDMRVSTFPTIYGEKIVLRILDKERMILGLEQLGFSPSTLSLFKKSISRPNGIILVTGPTGSGKTTTLYSALAEVNSVEKNVMTLEDPVEYELPDVHQSQINLKAGLTFASGLRAMLRQDPDIILVGEIRDSDTVDVAIRAALTGHLVFSTLHTNDAAGSIPRLLDMEVNASLMASTIIAIIGQRLVRKICPHCKEKTVPDESLLQMVGLGLSQQGISFYHGKGCSRCFQTGYRGRIGIFEVLVVSPSIAQLINQRASDRAILEKAGAEGMTNMMRDGVEKAKLGITTLEEVIRVSYTVS